MTPIATTAFVVVLISCAAACGLANRPHTAGSAGAVATTKAAQPSAVSARRPVTANARRGATAPLDYERLRAANAMAVLHVGLSGLSLPARD